LPEEAVALGYVIGCKTYGRRLRASALELRGDKLTIRLGSDTLLPPRAVSALYESTAGRVRVARADRLVADVPATGRRERRLQVCQDLLAELVTHLPS